MQHLNQSQLSFTNIPVELQTLCVAPRGRSSLAALQENEDHVSDKYGAHVHVMDFANGYAAQSTEVSCHASFRF